LNRRASTPRAIRLGQRLCHNHPHAAPAAIRLQHHRQPKIGHRGADIIGISHGPHVRRTHALLLGQPDQCTALLQCALMIPRAERKPGHMRHRRIRICGPRRMQMCQRTVIARHNQVGPRRRHGGRQCLKRPQRLIGISMGHRAGFVQRMLRGAKRLDAPAEFREAQRKTRRQRPKARAGQQHLARRSFARKRARHVRPGGVQRA
jgi:hypothetical protein